MVGFLKKLFGPDSHTEPLTAATFERLRGRLNARIADRRTFLYQIASIAGAMLASNISVCLALRPQATALLDLYLSLGLLFLAIVAPLMAILAHHDLTPSSNLYGVSGEQGIHSGSINPNRYCYNILRRDNGYQYHLVGVSIVFLIFGAVLLMFGLVFGLLEYNRGTFDTFGGWMILIGCAFPVVWMYFAAIQRFVKQRNPTPSRAHESGIVV